MHVVDLIRKKRDGGVLTDAEIAALVAGAAANSIPEYQLAAWLMAVFWRGLNAAELHSLTTHMRDSGKVLSFSSLPGAKVDKHSTGGVGDKTSFLVAPIAAAAGLCVPMISGRALGHTGGTLDKLESIPGYRTHLQEEEIRAVLSACGLSIVRPDRMAGPGRSHPLLTARPHSNRRESVPHLRIHHEQEARRRS